MKRATAPGVLPKPLHVKRATAPLPKPLQVKRATAPLPKPLAVKRATAHYSDMQIIIVENRSCTELGAAARGREELGMGEGGGGWAGWGGGCMQWP